MKKNIMIFPCKSEHKDLIGYLIDYIDDSKGITLVTPKNWSKPVILNRDLSYIDDILSSNLENIEELLVLNVEELQHIDLYLKKVFDMFDAHNIPVKLLCNDTEIIHKYRNYNNVIPPATSKFYFDKNKKSLYKPQAIIMGLGKILSVMNTDKYILSILKIYNKKGLTVKIISDNPNYLYLDCVLPFPTNFMKEESDNSILLLNEFIESVDKEFKPDLILIDFPKAMMKFSEFWCEDFGVSSFVISQAVDFDYFYVLGPLDINDEELINTLISVFEKKLNIYADKFLLENSFLDLNDLRESDRIGFRENNSEKLRIANHKNVSIPIHDTDCFNVIEESITKLSEYEVNI
ncbi:hypothetical protein [Enterococcus sp. CSURQ0835]|uniref:hypothetical protein n=1 Tax=Enterococcus sp. CSURQ0835 TaxID=2681394 RepID=UPI001358EFEE|nr:hypothetical protein [Enterococcus sp. CSURQ0835]